MKYQRKPEPGEKQNYSSPARGPMAYKPGLSHSSQSPFFRYSVIETGPLTYELDSNPLCATYTIPAHSGLPAETDLSMGNPDTYLRSIGKYSESSGILHSGKKSEIP
ncbi:hypothetical protein FTO70_15170 [Methanosarcina sp. KYL-1]|uniref:hypothetical protein n=1 Tax=Methanosarcina sp. KYL-1 TaxID=2602068 RepID=UPI002100CC24|nr:hypothetical protein [Methanosarcina sp. KYL-1]MCQ1536986.1 hypothetical protein [Methanosarcina sp. KYL-1]